MAHIDKLVYVLLAISRTRQAGIVAFVFHDCLAIEIGKPSLDGPCRNEDEHGLAQLSPWNLLLIASRVELYEAFGNAAAVTINQYR